MRAAVPEWFWARKQCHHMLEKVSSYSILTNWSVTGGVWRRLRDYLFLLKLTERLTTDWTNCGWGRIWIVGCLTPRLENNKAIWFAINTTDGDALEIGYESLCRNKRSTYRQTTLSNRKKYEIFSSTRQEGIHCQVYNYGMSRRFDLTTPISTESADKTLLITIILLHSKIVCG